MIMGNYSLLMWMILSGIRLAVTQIRIDDVVTVERKGGSLDFQNGLAESLEE